MIPLAFEINCLGCGHSLYYGRELVSAGDVLKRLNRRCEKCGTELSIDRFKVEVERSDGTGTRVETSSQLRFAPVKMAHA